MRGPSGNSVATIWGMAETAAAKTAMRVAAENVAGIKEVHDQVNIMPEMVRATLWAE
jgi:osmotically-inducible protein OsmY